MSTLNVNLVHTKFHQKQDMCMVNQYPCVVWHHSLSRHVTLWNIYNLTWNMTCVTHIWVNVKVFYNLRISSEFQLYEFAASSAECSEIPSNKYSSKWAGLRPGWSHSVLDLKQVSLTSLPPPCLGRPRPGLSDSLLLGKFSLLHLIRAGAQSHLWASPGTDGHQAAKCGAREKSVQWQYLSLF